MFSNVLFFIFHCNSVSQSCVQVKKLLADLSELMSDKDALAQRCQELDLQVNIKLVHNVILFRHKVLHKALGNKLFVFFPKVDSRTSH